jgi:energy-coupling factor transporter ATP-binding protein EcfA2
MQFQTPEKFFQASNQSIHTDFSHIDLGFCWKKYYNQSKSLPPIDQNILAISRESSEIVLLMGPPASGKSTLARRMEEASGGHCTRINQDALKTKAACLKAAQAALRGVGSGGGGGLSVVIDSTNGSTAQRADWLALAKQVGVVSYIALLVHCFSI